MNAVQKLSVSYPSLGQAGRSELFSGRKSQCFPLNLKHSSYSIDRAWRRKDVSLSFDSSLKGPSIVTALSMSENGSGSDENVTGTIVNDNCYGMGHLILGVDIGGTSIKAAPVDTRTGRLIEKKHVILTPQPATPEACAFVIKQMCDHFNWKGSLGVGVPAVVRQGIVMTAANIDNSWIGTNAEQLFQDSTNAKRVVVVNDADAAGYAELGFGAAAGVENEKGVVCMVTFGTGIGCAVFVDGILVPNLELGHLELDGVEAEKVAAGVMVQLNNWTWPQWADKVTWYLSYLERLLWPTLFVIGGGVSDAHTEWLHMVSLPQHTPLKPATAGNDAGIIGAALAALAQAAFDETQRPQQVDLLTA